MQDVFIEYMVKQLRTPKQTLLKLLLIVGAIFFAIISLMFSGFLGPFAFFGPILAIAICYGAYYVISSMNVEFEYSITNGEMDVDKIIAQRRRRRLATIRWRDVETFGKYNHAEHADKEHANKIFACDTPYSEDVWYCVTRVPQKGQIFIVFNANEKMIEAIKKYLPKQILFSVFKRG